MSVADSAEYQLEQLAATLEALSEIPDEGGKDSQRDFEAGWQAALESVARDMNLKVKHQLKIER